MPIAQIIVYGEAAGLARQKGAEITDEIAKILTGGLMAKPELVQVVLTEALARPQSCEVLCQIFHRASEARSTEVRAKAAEALREYLERRFNTTVRVRLMAIDPAFIASSDSVEVVG